MQLDQGPAALDRHPKHLGPQRLTGTIDLEGESTAVSTVDHHSANPGEPPEPLRRLLGTHRHRHRNPRPPLRARPQLRRRAFGDQLAAIDDHHPLAQELDLGQDVGRQQQGALTAEVADQIANRDDLTRVETHGRLIEDQHLRAVEDCRREANTLAVAFRQGLDHLAADVGEQAPLDRRVDCRACGRTRHSGELGAPREVLLHPHFGVERDVLGEVPEIAFGRDRLAGDVLAAHQHPTGGRRQKAGEHADGGGLARPVWPQHPDDLAVT